MPLGMNGWVWWPASHKSWQDWVSGMVSRDPRVPKYYGPNLKRHGLSHSLQDAAHRASRAVVTLLVLARFHVMSLTRPCGTYHMSSSTMCCHRVQGRLWKEGSPSQEGVERTQPCLSLQHFAGHPSASTSAMLSCEQKGDFQHSPKVVSNDFCWLGFFLLVPPGLPTSPCL